jgi:hypothetical protein
MMVSTQKALDLYSFLLYSISGDSDSVQLLPASTPKDLLAIVSDYVFYQSG